MALAFCKACGAEVSSTARECPKCGTRNPTVTNKEILKTVAILAFIAFSLYIIFAGGGRDDATEPQMDMAATDTPEARIQVDTSSEAQQARQAAIDDAISLGLFHDLQATDRTARLYVTELFMDQPFEAKRDFVRAVAAWHYTNTGNTHVRLIDYKTNNTVGNFTAEAGGLSMTD